MLIETEDLEKKSTIAISEDLRNALKDLGKKGESYEDVLWRLVKFYEGKSKQQK